MPTQNASATLYTLAETAINAATQGSSYAIPSTPNASITAAINIWTAPTSTTTPASGIVVHVQVHKDASGNEQNWEDLVLFGTGTTAAVTDTTTAAITGGSGNTVAMTGAATFGARTALLYIRDSSSAGEWIYALKQASSTLTLPTNATFQVSHSSGVSIYSQAQMNSLLVDVSGYKRMRLLIDNNTQATGPGYAVFATIETWCP